METKKNRWILYLISVTIIITVTVQLYWNFKNYQQNKQRIKNEIQLSLDNAIEIYFADFSKNKYITIIESDTITNTSKNNLIQKLLNPSSSINKKRNLFQNRI